MSQSSLVDIKMLTSNFGYPDGRDGRCGMKIDKIFVHHMAGVLTAEQCGSVFKNREASAHYGIDGKGRIGQYVLEENVAWHTGNYSYNCRSIGIELANTTGASGGWKVADITIQRCIDLIVDICRRNGIEAINYTGDLKGNLCMHTWVTATSCPGPYLKTKFKYIADQVNKRLKADKVSDKPKKDPEIGDKYKVVRKKGLWLYEEPSKKSEHLLRIDCSTVFTVHDTKIGKTSCFAKIKKQNKWGWILIYDKNGAYCEEKVPVPPNKLIDKAVELAWPKGTAESKYKYPSGKPTNKFKKALDRVYPQRGSWGKASRVGASCDVFAGTCIRDCGLDPKFPRGLREQMVYKSSAFDRYEYKNAKPYDKSKDGDIVMFTHSGGAHIVIRGNGYYYEANYQMYYGHTNTSLERLKKAYPTVVILRPKAERTEE